MQKWPNFPERDNKAYKKFTPKKRKKKDVAYVDFQVAEGLGAGHQLLVVFLLDQLGDEALRQGVGQRLQRHLYCPAQQVLVAGQR